MLLAGVLAQTVRQLEWILHHIGSLDVLSEEACFKLQCQRRACCGRRRRVDKARAQHLLAQPHGERNRSGVRFREGGCIEPGCRGRVVKRCCIPVLCKVRKAPALSAERARGLEPVAWLSWLVCAHVNTAQVRRRDV